jgi:hypothetical protein
MAAHACKVHPDILAEWQCEGCWGVFCSPCVKDLSVGKMRVAVCTACGERTIPLTPIEKGIPPRSFFPEVPGAFSYPFRKKGWIMLIVGTLFFTFMNLIPFVGWLIAGYLCSFAIKIIACSANGEDEMPDWPDLTNVWDDIILPLALLLLTLFLCLVPALAWGVGVSNQQPDAIFWILVGAGMLYLPMGLLAVALFHTLLALNPVLVIGSILKAPLSYGVAALAFIAVYAISLFGQTVLAEAVPYAGPALAGFVSLYLLIVAMRILGMFYHTN